MGHSFGGRLVLELAARAPGRVQRLVLLDPAVWVPPPRALERRGGSCERRVVRLAEEAVEARFDERVLNDLVPRSILEEEIAEHLEPGADGRWRYRYARVAVIAAYGEMAKGRRSTGSRVPALVVRGADSEVVPEPLVADDCASSTPGSSRSWTCPAATSSCGTRSRRPAPRWSASSERNAPLAQT